jgi:hypothetical protein
MLIAYRRSLLELFSKVQQLSPVPHRNAELSLEIQEILIRRITYVERIIRKLKTEIKEYRRELGTKRSSPLSKQEAEQIKQAVEADLYRIDRYNELIFIFKSVGDAIAHTYISKWDIKPMGFKESPGFISGKKGSRLERQILRRSSEKGVTVILNDLTNCLRYGDITVPRGDGPFMLVEAKSINKKQKKLDQRGKRQLEAMNKINSYLASDTIRDLFGIRGPVVRFSVKEEERNHIPRLNKLIEQGLINGEAYDEVEKGLFYFVSTHSRPEKLEVILRRCKEPIVGFAHLFKYENLGYYPFTLAIKNPLALYKFYLGSLVIVVIIDSAIIRKRFEHDGFSVEIRMDEVRPIILSRQGLEAPITIGNHLFNRVFAEFLSLEWLLDELANGVNSADSRIAEFLAANPQYELENVEQNENTQDIGSVLP